MAYPLHHVKLQGAQSIGEYVYMRLIWDKSGIVWVIRAFKVPNYRVPYTLILRLSNMTTLGWLYFASQGAFKALYTSKHLDDLSFK